MGHMSTSWTCTAAPFVGHMSRLWTLVVGLDGRASQGRQGFQRHVIERLAGEFGESRCPLTAKISALGANL